MIRLLALVVIVGCSSGARSGGSASPAGSAAPAETESAGSAASPGAPSAAADVTAFITPEVTAVLRSRGEHFLTITHAAKVAESLPGSKPPCWTKLVQAVVTAYQLNLILGAGSYFVLEGALPRDEVEACVRTALPGVKIERDGDLVAFRLDGAGTAYAAWRGSLVVVGTKDRVSRALGGDPEAARTWRDRLAELPPTPVAFWSADAMFAVLFGVMTTSYVLVLDRLEAKTPAAAGRWFVRYANTGDAAVAARRIKQGELHLSTPAPVEVVNAFKQMKVKQAGTTVEVGFDLDMFEGMDLDGLRRWFGQPAAAARP